eukprot:256-Rhodomonas_salina.3
MPGTSLRDDIVSGAMSLCTPWWYLPTRSVRDVFIDIPYGAICLRAPYAMSGTDIAYDAVSLRDAQY